MKSFSYFAAACLLALAAPAIAGRAYVRNACGSPVWVCVTRQCQGCTASCTKVNAQGTWSESYHGSGNSVGVARSPDYYSPSTAKVILGYSDVNGRVYYSLSTVDGNPFRSFQLVPTDLHNCQALDQNSQYQTKDCEDAADIKLSVYC